MNSVAHCGYRIVAEQDEHAQHIVALNDDGAEICGAYRPQRLNDWRVFSTKILANAIGLPQPQKAHVVNRDDALRWVQLLAALYTGQATR